MIIGVGRNAGDVMPTQGQVSAGVVYGYPDTRTGTLDAPPAKPVITGVIDNGDADSVTVSLTTTPITNTLQLYYRQRNVSAWTTGLTRVGSGDIIQTGLTAGTWYEMYATADNGAESAPSNVVFIYLASTSATGTIKTAVYAILMGDAPLQALVSGRVTPGGDPMRGQTSVTYHQISGVREHTMDGPDTFVTPTMQVNSYGMTDLEANNVADAVREALDGYSGTVDGVAISYFALTDQGDLDDYEAENKKLSRHGVRQDYLMSYQEN